MCLYIGTKRSFTAKNDIVVYKYVSEKDGKYYTACQEYPINVNETLKPAKSNDNIIDEIYNKYAINGGAIHACTTTINSGFDGHKCLKAIIKKGVEFFIQDDLKQVAAKELYITDEIVNGNETTDINEYINEIIESSDDNSNGIKIGYYRLSNGTFINPINCDNFNDVIGVVAYFIGNNPVCISTKVQRLPWMKSYVNNVISSDISFDSTKSDMDGMKHTLDILTSKDYNSNNFEAIDYCANFYTDGTNKGDWYLPAIGECIKISQNLLFINAALSYGGFETIGFENIMWSSSETKWDGCSGTWGCYLDDGDCSSYCSLRDYAGVVCPCLAFINEA